MSIKKEYSQNNDECKVTFILPKDIAENFHTISVLGDFNLWDQHINQFCKNEADGTCTATVILEPQKKYQFRYLADGVHWFNEDDADEEVDSYYKGFRNSVIVV
jgi:1,4-alpha-glucan branching enzyme